MSTKQDTIKTERENAWLGDAVLALFARNFVLQERKCMDGEWFTKLTSNEFLSAFGNPTRVESNIGLIYQQQGLQAAFSHIETEFIPLFRKQISRKK